MKKLIIMASLLIAKNSFAANVDTFDYPTGTLTVKTWYCDLINKDNSLTQKTESSNRNIYNILDISLIQNSAQNLEIKLNQSKLSFTDNGAILLGNVEIAQIDPDQTVQKMKSACMNSKEEAQNGIGLANIASFQMEISFSTAINLQKINLMHKCQTNEYEVLNQKDKYDEVASATTTSEECFHGYVLKIGNLKSIFKNTLKKVYTRTNQLKAGEGTVTPDKSGLFPGTGIWNPGGRRVPIRD